MKSAPALVLVLLAVGPSTAIADGKQCLEIQDNNARLECFERHFKGDGSPVNKPAVDGVKTPADWLLKKRQDPKRQKEVWRASTTAIQFKSRYIMDAPDLYIECTRTVSGRKPVLFVGMVNPLPVDEKQDVYTSMRIDKEYYKFSNKKKWTVGRFKNDRISYWYRLGADYFEKLRYADFITMTILQTNTIVREKSKNSRLVATHFISAKFGLNGFRSAYDTLAEDCAKK